MGESLLRRWVAQLQLERGGVTPTAKALTPEQQMIQELQVRINRLELEKKILKEATALLMAEEYGRSLRVLQRLNAHLLQRMRALQGAVPRLPSKL